jgi:hypothetical protein
MSERKRIWILVVSFLISSLFLGCGSATVKTGLKIDKTEEIVVNKTFPYVTFDEVWDAVILVVMQQGVIVQASKDNAVISVNAEQPFTISIMRGEEVNVHIDNKNMAEIFFYKLATQLYAAEKWKYLYKIER